MAERLSEWAARKRIHPKTAYKMWAEGRMPVPTERFSERVILVHDPEYQTKTMDAPSRTVIYARVSSSEQKEDLERQIVRVVTQATKQGYLVGEVVQEVSSGLNAKRPKLNKLLSDKTVKTIIVEHRDRFSRFGLEMVQAALSAQGREIVILDNAEVEDDLVRDMTEMLTSFCARLYGKRSAAHRAQKAVKAVQENA